MGLNVLGTRKAGAPVKNAAGQKRAKKTILVLATVGKKNLNEVGGRKHSWGGVPKSEGIQKLSENNGSQMAREFQYPARRRSNVQDRGPRELPAVG